MTAPTSAERVAAEVLAAHVLSGRTDHRVHWFCRATDCDWSVPLEHGNAIYAMDAHRAHLATILASRLVPIAGEAALMEFVNWVATQRAYNGADNPGQALYDEMLNAVLPTWAVEFLRARAGGTT